MSLRSAFSAFFYGKEILLADQFNFGNREIIVRTHNLSLGTLFLGRLQHGWIPSHEVRSLKKIRNCLFQQYPVFVWSSRQQIKYRQDGHKKVFAVGAPWAHLLKFKGIDPIKSLEIAENKPGLNASDWTMLFFPAHSIQGGSNAHATKIDILLAKSGVRSVTVCLFWLDFIDPDVRGYYERLGCSVECVGYKGATGFESPWSPVGGRVDFIENLFSLIGRFDVVAIEEISTTFFYALSLSKHVYLTTQNGESTWWVDKDPKIIKYDNVQTLMDIGFDVNLVPIETLIAPNPLLLNLALSELGWDCVTDPQNALLLERHRIDLEFLKKINEVRAKPLGELIPPPQRISNLEIEL